MPVEHVDPDVPMPTSLIIKPHLAATQGNGHGADEKSWGKTRCK